MNTLHYAHWPQGLPHELVVPEASVYTNLQVSALRYPNKAAIIFYDSIITYSELHAEVLALAGYLQQVCGVQRGDRVLLNMQNCPQFIIGFYAILRADAMVVPVNPMLMTDELSHYIADSGAKTALVSQEIFSRLQPLIGHSILQNAIVATYSDHLTKTTSLNIPDFVKAERQVPEQAGVCSWQAAVTAGYQPQAHMATPEDLACMPYTSGTTGKPKGCIHTHRSVIFNSVASPTWSGSIVANHVSLAVLPFFHVTGMQSVMNSMIYCGGTLVILPRWDRDVAGQLITRYAVSI